MENNKGAEPPISKLQFKDRELLINQFNASGKIWEILPTKFKCETITNDCLSCSDGQTNITLCSECESVMVVVESGELVRFTPYDILREILVNDPLPWLISEGWISTLSFDGQVLTRDIGKVSFFPKPISNTVPSKELTVGDVYEFIRGEALMDVTIQLRNIKKQDEKKYKAEKEKRLPYITPGGTFKRRADNELKEKSELMGFDIDHIENVEKVKTELRNDKNLGIVLIFTSPGGDGIKMVITSPFNLEYKEGYERVMQYLKTHHGINCDSTKEISRACFLCHDPNIYYNENASVTQIPISPMLISLEQLPITKSNGTANSKKSDTLYDIQKVETYLEELEKNGIDITLIYDEWIKLGFSFAILGEPARSLFHRLSKMHSEYSYDEADKKFSNFLNSASGRISLGTFFYHCHKLGVRPNKAISSNYMAAPMPSAILGRAQTNGQVKAAVNGKAVNKNQDGEQPTAENDWDDILRRHKINLTDEILIPPIAWKNGKAICGTLGEFSLLIGKAKSRKSFFVSLIVAGILNPEDPGNPISGALPNGKTKVIYFDTEQSKYHVQRALNRIRAMIGDKLASAELIVYALRPLSPKERMAAIEHAITNTEGIGVGIIDGIADLQTDINNPDQAVMVATKLLQWTDIYGIHMVTVLHENKGNRNARGHLGTELVNKAETTLSITKDTKNPDISIVEPEYCRGIAPEPFAFEINENGVPIKSHAIAVRMGSTVKANNLASEAVTQIFNMVFAKADNIFYGSLWQGIKHAYHKLYKGNFSDKEAKALVEQAKFDGIIYQDRLRGPYTLKKVDG